MTLVRILKPLGFEQVGDIVIFKGDVEGALERGEVEVLGADPRPVVNSQTVVDEDFGFTEPEVEETVEESSFVPEEVVEGE